MRNEIFNNYVDTIRNCSSLPIKLRNKAARILIKMKRDEETSEEEYINEIQFSLDIDDNEIKLYGLFIWEKTNEGFDFWKKIADAGF